MWYLVLGPMGDGATDAVKAAYSCCSRSASPSSDAINLNEVE